MAKSNYLTTIAIDAQRSAFHFYTMLGEDRQSIAHHIKSYAGGRMDGDFFKKFKDAVSEFAADTPTESARKVTVILPDNAVLTDVVRVPTMKGLGQTKKTLDVTLSGLYLNYKDLRVNSQVAQQNKQYSTFSVAAVQKSIVSSVYAACAENKMIVDTLTYASSAAAGGAAAINPKLKNASYLLLDIKDVYASFVFVSHGKTVGHYTLPFGLEFLCAPKITQEDMLFDHSMAELAVINARERAKSKKLTVMSLESEDEEDTELEGEEAAAPEPSAEAAEETAEEAEDATEELDGEAQTSAPETSASPILLPNQKIYTRKAPRKLPKFMLRDVADSQADILYENFRIFVKWALILLQGNEKLTELGAPEFVCVNLPADIAYILDVANLEVEENGISFTRLAASEDAPDVLDHLELYGGFFPRLIGSTGKF